MDSNPYVPTGFPHYDSYLPLEGPFNYADLWPLAQKQVESFLDLYHRACRKLRRCNGNLPEAFGYWWIRSWIKSFLTCAPKEFHEYREVRALYQFARKASRVLSLSNPSRNEIPHELEFTYYNWPLTTDSGAELLAHFGEQAEEQGYLPTPFPRMEHEVARISCEQFMEWAGYLTDEGELTPEQLQELSHVGCSEGGQEYWCQKRMHATECQKLLDRILAILQTAVIQVSDRLAVGACMVLQNVAFDLAIIPVSQWMESVGLRYPASAGCNEPPPPMQTSPAAITSLQDANHCKPKRSTLPGEARIKIIGALTTHHQYSEGSCLNFEPVGNNQLAKLAKVSRSTVSEFFEAEFETLNHYRVICRTSKGRLIDRLQKLNGEKPPRILRGPRPDAR